MTEAKLDWNAIVAVAEQVRALPKLPEEALRLAQTLDQIDIHSTLEQLIHTPNEQELETVLQFAQRARADWLATACRVLLIEWFDPFEPFTKS